MIEVSFFFVSDWVSFRSVSFGLIWFGWVYFVWVLFGLVVVFGFDFWFGMNPHLAPAGVSGDKVRGREWG